MIDFENYAERRHLGFASSVRSIFFGSRLRVGKSKQTVLRCFPVWEKRVKFLKKPDLLVQQMRACTVKKVIGFPVPSRDVTNQTHPGRELLNYFRRGRVWLVTSRLGTVKSITFFYSSGGNKEIRICSALYWLLVNHFVFPLGRFLVIFSSFVDSICWLTAWSLALADAD